MGGRLPAPVGVVGAGTMGAGIACAAALAGFEVILQDISEEILSSAIARIASDLQSVVDSGKLSPGDASQVRERIHPDSSPERFSRCGFVIEAAGEELALKRQIFSQLESVCPPGAILATNTSSLSVTAIASALEHPERAAGLHFFNPPRRMKLVEIVRAERTSEDTVERCRELTAALGKKGVVVRDTPGFIVNRVARPFYGEALRLLGEGVATAGDIDRIVRLEGGFRMGPFELMDLIGIDINFAVTKSLFERTFGEPRYRPHAIQESMVNAGTLGRKTGRGFYTYGR